MPKDDKTHPTDKAEQMASLRKLAESYLSEARPDDKDFSELELKELLHELYIHQAELEIQNEELQQAREELETERNRYLELFESAPMGYFILDESGTVQDVNLTGAQMVQTTRRRMIGRQFSRLVTSRHRPVFYAHFQAVKSELGNQVCELEMLAGESVPVPVRLESTVVLNGGERIKAVRAAVSDISARKTAEAERKDARTEAARHKGENIRLLERFRMVAENTNSAIFICDPERFRFVNSAAEHLTGRNRKTLMETLPWRVLKPTDRARAEGFLKEALENEAPGRTCTLTLLTPDGEERQAEVTINQVFDGGQPAVLGTAIDITAHKMLENELKERLDVRTLELTEALRKLEEEVAEDAASSAAVAERTQEAEALKQKIENLNTTMDVLLQKRQEDRRKIEENITANIHQVIMPEIQTLKRNTKKPEIRRSLDLLEKALNEMTAPFTCALTGRYNLTATEIRIAQLIKEGLTSDEISEHLNLAAKTISYHRNNIRKKLGLHNKKANLQTHLLSLS